MSKNSKKFSSTKIYDGFSTCFRQWRANGTHCKYLHGYSVSVEVTFEGDLDYRNWVYDFGGSKRSESKIDGMNPNDLLTYLFDHTTIIASDDPFLDKFKELDELGVLRLRILPYVGCERFAEHIYERLHIFVSKKTNGRVKVSKVTVREHDKNSASYSE